MKKADLAFIKIPDSPGVYSFSRRRLTQTGRRSTQNEVLYIGRATSLRDRIRSYFSKDLAEIRSPLVAKSIADADSVSWEETDSVLEAFILESKRIKEHWPKGNTDEKDDKSFAYLIVTKEVFPRFLVFRERELAIRAPRSTIQALYGPFLSAASLREALKITRRIFPFFDTKFSLEGKLSPSAEKTLRFNQAIGLYPREFDEKAYKKTVRNVRLLFEGKKSVLFKMLEKDMKAAARTENFEKAEECKRQLFSLKHIQDVTLIREELRAPHSVSFRIEAYDTAHLRGESARGVMAVVVDGEAVPAEYRTFTIRKAKGGDDLAALSEVIERRAKHREWHYPQLVVIDGGRTHLNHGKKVFSAAGIDVDVVSVVKDERHKPREIFGSSSLVHTHEKEILLANAEAHRFAIGRHRRALRRIVR